MLADIRYIRPGHRPDQGLPGGEGPVDPDYGIDAGGHPSHPIELPEPPPGVWPPPTVGHPIQPLPPTDGTPPGTIWPSPGRPSHPIARPPVRPDQGLPGAPGHPDQGLPGTPGGPAVSPPQPGHLPAPTPTKFWVVAGIPGYGWRYVCVDPTLRPDQGLPGGPGAQPK